MVLMGQHREIQKKLLELYSELFLHNGYGSLQVEMRFLKRGQKEIVVSCGKEFRYVVDYPGELAAAKPRPGMPAWHGEDSRPAAVPGGADPEKQHQ